MTTPNPKQQAIRKAYGEHYDKCDPDENGWSNEGGEDGNPIIDTYEETKIEGVWRYRPLALKGIENNRGWHRIDGPDDLPKEVGNYRFKRRDNKRNEVAHYAVNRYADEFFSRFYTHWRPVEEVPEPVY